MGELLKNQISITLNDLKKNIKEKIDQLEEKAPNQIDINEIVNHYILTNSIRKFFVGSQLSQLMEETNPLAEVTHKRKISSFGVGAIERKKANLNIREVNTSQYGKVCPIETTEGKNAGLILSLTKGTSINKYGFIESPFYL